MKSFHNIYNNINKSFPSLSKLHLRKFPKFFARLPPVNPQKKLPTVQQKHFHENLAKAQIAFTKLKLTCLKIHIKRLSTVLIQVSGISSEYL